MVFQKTLINQFFLTTLSPAVMGFSTVLPYIVILSLDFLPMDSMCANSGGCVVLTLDQFVKFKMASEMIVPQREMPNTFDLSFPNPSYGGSY